MSARTYYLAHASSAWRDARSYMDQLDGMGLVNAMDWTVPLSAHESEWSALAGKDIDAATGCDVFVLVGVPESYGAMSEFGARLAVAKRAHVVGPPWHFFFRHELVTRHESWADFVASVHR